MMAAELGSPTPGVPTKERGKLSILMFSGTADKVLPLGIITRASAAMGMRVQAFVTGFALLGFTRQRHELPVPAEFAAMAPALSKAMEASQLPAWDVMIRRAKQMGSRVYVCSAMCEVMGLARQDFGDLVDEMVGTASFVEMAENGETHFI